MGDWRYSLASGISSRPGRFTPGTYWIGGLVDLRARLDVVGKRELFPLPGMEPLLLGRPARSPVATPAELFLGYVTQLFTYK
jgi:hypothetical protein